MQLFNPPVPVLLGIIFVLALTFLVWFALPGAKLQYHLSMILRKLKPSTEPELSQIDRGFSSEPRLAALWKEYRESLHEEKEFITATGSLETVRFRSTVPAEFILTNEAVVDCRVNSEFFKHLPGILTGIGIIGTFLGLINGLAAFNISDNPQAVRESLNHLMDRVHGAFTVSVTAIFVAVVITILEKWLTNNLYRSLASVTQRLDNLFQNGTGEDYLGRLVRSSESAEKEAKVLKDALVEELALVLDRVTTNQISESSKQLSSLQQGIVSGISESLDAPMANISAIAEKLGGSQIDAVNSLLTDTLAQFSAQMRDMFGNQFAGASAMQQQTTRALEDTLLRVSQLTDRVGAASETASSTIGTQVAEALSQMEERQRTMADFTASVVGRMQLDFQKTSAETTANVVGTIESLGKTTESLVKVLQAQVEQSSKRDEARAAVLVETVKDTQTRLSGQVKEILEQQLAGANGIQQETSRALGGTLSAVTQLSDHVATASDRAASVIAAQVADALTRMESHQRAMAELIATVASKMQSSIAATNEEATASAIRTVDALGQRSDDLVRILQVQVEQSSFRDEARAVALTDAVSRTQGQMSEQVKDMLEQQLVAATALQQQTARALEGTLSGVMQLSDRLGNATESASSTIAKQVADALTRMESHQRTMADFVAAAMAKMQSSFADASDQTTASVVRTVDALATRSDDLVRILQAQVAQSALRDETRSAALAEAVDRTQGNMSIQVKDMLDRQLVAADAVQQQTARALEGTLSGVMQLSDRLGDATEAATSTIATQVADALTRMESHQRTMADFVAAAMTKMQSSFADASDQTTASVVRTVDALGTRSDELLRLLQSQVELNSDRDEARAASLAESSEKAHARVASSLSAAADQMRLLQDAFGNAMNSFRDISTESFTEISRGADAISNAARDFATAGHESAAVLAGSSELLTQISQLSTALNSSASIIDAVLSDYKSVRAEFANLVPELSTLIDSARRDASVSEVLVSQIERASAKLASSQSEVEQYLSKVSEVLLQGFSQFQSGLEHSIRGANREFNEELTRATKLLKQRIDDLGEVLDARSA